MKKGIYIVFLLVSGCSKGPCDVDAEMARQDFEAGKHIIYKAWVGCDTTVSGADTLAKYFHFEIHAGPECMINEQKGFDAYNA